MILYISSFVLVLIQPDDGSTWQLKNAAALYRKNKVCVDSLYSFVTVIMVMVVVKMVIVRAVY